MTRWTATTQPPIAGGQVCYMLAGKYAVDLLDCCQCGEHAHIVHRLIARNGSTQLRGVCARCALVHPRALSHDDWHPSDFPIVDDRTIHAVPCERCGERGGTEEHHWAPVSMFSDADDWPTSFLCQPCHGYWHRVTGVAV